MPRRFLATFEYTEMVGGEPRTFVHETIVEAADTTAANRAALNHFDMLTRQSGSGWVRKLTRCSVAPAPRHAEPRGGRRVPMGPEVED